jgi:hypothetical protein
VRALGEKPFSFSLLVAGRGGGGWEVFRGRSFEEGAFQDVGAVAVVLVAPAVISRLIYYLEEKRS